MNQERTSSSTESNSKNAIQSLKTDGHDLVDQFRGVTADLGERLSKTGKQVSSWTKENPVQAVLIGAGVGFLMGAIARRAAMRSITHSAKRT